MRKRVGWLFLVVLIAGCSGSGSDVADGSAGVEPPTAPEVSEIPFCAVIDESVDRMTSASAAAGGTASGQFALFLNNLSETDRMIGRLTSVAPSEIKSDMEVVAADWARLGETARQAANDPLGAAAGSLMSSLLSVTSYERVDEFALATCGTTLFSFGSSPAAPRCPWLSTLDSGEVLSPGQPVADLVSVLGTIADNVEAEAERERAESLQEALRDLEPSPRLAREGIGRIELAGGASVDSLLTLNEGLSIACNGTAFDQDHIDNIAEGSLTFRDDRAEYNSPIWGECTLSHFGSLLDEWSVVTRCGESAAILELSTGVPLWLDDLAGFEGAYDARITREHSAWIVQTVTPASGTTPASAVVELRVQQMESGEMSTVVIPPNGQQTTQRTSIHHMTPEVIVTDTDGRFDVWSMQLLPIATDLESGLNPVLPHLAAMGNDAIINLRTGEIQSFSGGFTPIDVIRASSCPDRGIMGTTDGFHLIWERSGEINVLGPFNDGPGGSDGQPILGVFVGRKPYDYAAFDRTGAKSWELSGDLGRFDTFGGWVVVLNTSEQVVIVDPLTGTEATEVSGELRSTLERWILEETGDLPVSDEITDVFFGDDFVYFQSFHDIWRVTRSEFCPLTDAQVAAVLQGAPAVNEIWEDAYAERIDGAWDAMSSGERADACDSIRSQSDAELLSLYSENFRSGQTIFGRLMAELEISPTSAQIDRAADIALSINRSMCR